MKTRMAVLILAALLLAGCLCPASAETPPLPDTLSRLATPFRGTPKLHREALYLYSNQPDAPAPAATGTAYGCQWERYDLRDYGGYAGEPGDAVYEDYLILTPDGAEVLGYAWHTSIEASQTGTFQVNSFSEAVAMVDMMAEWGEGKDLKDIAKAVLSQTTAEWKREFFPAAERERANSEMAALETAILTPGFVEGTAYYLYGHYLTVVSAGDDSYWFIFHNTADIAERAAAVDAPAPEAAPAPEGWTCENGHAGNMGKFCTECGSPKPVSTGPSFCTECGADLRGLNAKFCPNCGTPVELGSRQ